MPTWQFDGHFNPDGSVIIPPEVAAHLHPDDMLRVVISTEPEAESSLWQQITTEQFLQGYGPGDEIYDQLTSR